MKVHPLLGRAGIEVIRVLATDKIVITQPSPIVVPTIYRLCPDYLPTMYRLYSTVISL
jgi:hypothetical protein